MIMLEVDNETLSAVLSRVSEPQFSLVSLDSDFIAVTIPDSYKSNHLVDLRESTLYDVILSV